MAVCALTMLDGMGEEVIAAGGLFLLVLALVLAWLSTHVADRGDHILGTILTVGAHASLIGLGGHDSYSGGSASSADTPEQQAPSPPQENKPDEAADPGSESGEGPGDGDEGVGTDLLLDIQSKAHGGRVARGDDDDDDEADEDVDEEEEEEDDDDNEAGKETLKVQKLDPSADEASTATTISIRLKFVNDTEEVALVSPEDTVGLLKSKYFSGREHQVKLIYQGQLLQDPKLTLSSLNISHNSVIHCHVCQAAGEAAGPDEDPPSGPGSGAGSGLSGGIRAAGLALSTSSLVVPVFVVILAVVWYFRINYRQFFTAPATISLVGVTVFFSFLIFGMHSR